MATGPRKIVLINSGRYEYAEVELSGALQIVGPNNTGKTTLINTLQFLYLNDLRTMEFGYKWEQTRSFYFPNEYSYMLFECVGVRGACVIGWRGQSKASGGDPERFCFSGPYDPDDFFDAKQQVRSSRDVAARLALKDFRSIKSSDEHRELLLPPVGTDSNGLGIVALRDTDKYHQFREILKNLLTLSAITQEQMRDRVLMLAGISPDRTALNTRELFGDDYDRIRDRRERLLRFKEHKPLVEKLVDKFSERETVRGELIYRWTDLRAKRLAFETEHEKKIAGLTTEKNTQSALALKLQGDLQQKRQDLFGFSKSQGGVETELKQLADADKEFSQYTPDLERAAIQTLEKQFSKLEEQLRAAENESREKAGQRRDFFQGQVRDKEQTIARFDKVAVTALRKHFGDDDLNRLFRLINPDLLEYPMGSDGISVLRERELVGTLREIISRLADGSYGDPNVTIAFRGQSLPVARVANVEAVRERLKDDRDSLTRWQGILSAIEQREKLETERNSIRKELETKRAQLVRFNDHQTAKSNEKSLRDKLKSIKGCIEAAQELIGKWDSARQKAETTAREAAASITKLEDEFNKVMGEFNGCIFPEFSSKPQPVQDTPNDFGAAIALFLRQQTKQDGLCNDVRNLLADVERWFGEEFRGADEKETVRLLTEELEALTEKEEALNLEWNALIHTLRATFDQILQRLGDVHSARDSLNRHFAKVQVSDLKAVRMEVVEQSDLVSWIRRLAAFEAGGLFDKDTERESAITNFRKKLEGNPLIRFADLFTLAFTVVGSDDRAHTYHDFRQIESHGTTVTIKVLFNVLLLRSQLKRDDCQVPFFLDEIQILDPANRHAILETARKLGFIAITAAPDAVSEVDALYFLQPRKGSIVLRQKHRVGIKRKQAA
jgi:hypothetical protein